MKYCILLILSLMAFSAFSQSIMPSVEYLSLGVTGIQFTTRTSTTTHYPYEDTKYESSTGEYLVSSSFGKSDASGKVVGEGVSFNSSYWWEYQYNRYNEEKTVEIEIDTVNQLITRLHYQYKYSRVVYNDHPNDESKSFDIELRDIPYIQYGDTIVYSADRDLLQKYSNVMSYGGSSETRYTYSITYGNFNDLSPNASLTGKFAKLKTHSSFVMPKFYSIALDPDIKLRRYYTDSIVVLYRNDYPDTVTIQRIECIDNYLTDQTITYADEKPITTKHVVLPHTKDHKIYLSYTSFQGPYNADNSLTFDITKEIKGVTYHDTIVLSVSLKDADYEPYIMIDTSVPSQQLFFDSKVGDTIRESIRVDYTKEIYGLSFPPILDGMGFTLAGVEHGSNNKQVEFAFTSDSVGVFDLYYYFDYLVKDFKGITHYRQYSKPITLSAHVTQLQSVRINSESTDLQVFPNPTIGIVNVAIPGDLSSYAIISIYDILGNEVVSQRIENSKNIAQIALPNTLQSGSYYITLRADSKIYTSLLKVNR